MQVSYRRQLEGRRTAIRTETINSGSGNFTNNFSVYSSADPTFFSGTMPAMSVIGGNADTT